MGNYRNHILLLIKRIFILLLLFQISKIYFFVFNYNHFPNISPKSIAQIVLFSPRFDLFSIVLFNSIFIILHIIPGDFKDSKTYQLILRIMYTVVNALVILPDFIDSQFFSFTNKRSTADFFSVVGAGDDFETMLPDFLKDYWYVLLSYICFIFVLWVFFPAFKTPPVDSNSKPGKKKKIIIYVATILITTVLCVVIVRDVKLRPLSLISTAQFTAPQYVPLLINTSFTMAVTFNIQAMDQKKYFPKEELDNIYNPERNVVGNETPKPRNVVIIIMESFGQEYVGSLSHKKSYTPFLDSLITESVCFSNAFANASRSMEAMPAIIASLPAIMDNAFITSNYAANQITGIGSILKKNGYYTAFLHGGKNGTLSFDDFAISAGFDDYYGMREFGDDTYYDGKWGIYDEEYLQYSVSLFSSFKKPFLASIFTLSSHHPYGIPEKYKGKFDKGEYENHESIQYADFALKQFFRSAAKTDWYANTLFVITADHTSLSEDPVYINSVGNNKIPLLFFFPFDTLRKGIEAKTAQQIDIIPSILGLLDLSYQEVCFGSNLFDSTAEHYAIQYQNGIYQYVSDEFVYFFNGVEGTALFKISDKLLQNNIIENEPIIKEQYDRKLKAIIQSYDERMIGNKLAL